MPKRRRFTRRRKLRRRGGFRRRGGLRGLIKATVRRMSEVKWATDDQAVAFDASIGHVVLLSPLINQGAAKDERVGNSIKGKHVSFKLSVTGIPVGAAPAVDAIVTVVVFTLKNQQAAALPTTVDIFDVPSIAQNLPLMNSNSDQVSWKYHKTFILGTQGLPAVQTNLNTHRMLNINFPFRNNMSFVNNAGNVMTDPKDRIYLAICTNMIVPNVMSIGIQWNIRQSFRDL